jgi:hypothetical protein
MGEIPMDEEQSQAMEQRGKVDKESARRGVAKMNQVRIFFFFFFFFLVSFG